MNNIKSILREYMRTGYNTDWSDVEEYLELGRSPYCFEGVRGNFKLVKISKPDFDKMESNPIYFLSDREFEKINNVIVSTNELAKLYDEKIETTRKIILGYLQKNATHDKI
jgi:hypothetical protein